ncbi:MAG: 30S ribosomal protein S17 [Patescibacteria group bacterium]
MNKKSDKKLIRVIRGKVVSDKMDQTVVVLVDRVKTHPLYKKKFTVSKKYKAHDGDNAHKTGDTVEIVPSRPISKDKHYKVVRKIESTNG